MQCYAIKDEKAECFPFTPYFAKNQHDAVRGIKMEVNNPQSNLHHYSDDFSLFRLGVFNQETGVLTPNSNGPERITELSILKEQPKLNTQNKV